MEIEFQGYYDKDTLFKAVRCANRPSRGVYLMRIGLAILIVILFVLYLGAVTKDSSAGWYLVTIFVLLYFLFQPYIASRQVATALWKSAGMQEPVAGTISSQGVSYVSSENSREIEWSKFAKKQLTDDLIVLLTADRTLSFFPRRFFKTDNDWRIVVEWVNAKVVEAK